MPNSDKVLSLAQERPDIPLAAVQHMISVQKAKFPTANPRFWYLHDLNKKSNIRRMHCFDTKANEIVDVFAAHGAGSDANNDGIVDVVGNKVDSHMSSVGVFRIAETYLNSEHGLACRLDGLETSNAQARARGVVLHTAIYCTEAYVKANGKCGRSWGCPAVGTDHTEIITEAANGSFLCIWFTS